jgi:hypothetical protein
MKKIKFLIILLLTLPIFSYAQLDCSSFLSSLKPEDPFTINSMSKSATCISGHTYEFVVPLTKGYEYRFIFYASSVFNNDLSFRMIDLNTNKEVLNVPGKLADNQSPKKGQTALQPYFDEKLNKEVHPYFTIIPNSSTNVKIIIKVKDKPDLTKGCVTVVVLDREFGDGSFQ